MCISLVLWSIVFDFDAEVLAGLHSPRLVKNSLFIILKSREHTTANSSK